MAYRAIERLGVSGDSLDAKRRKGQLRRQGEMHRGRSALRSGIEGIGISRRQSRRRPPNVPRRAGALDRPFDRRQSAPLSAAAACKRRLGAFAGARACRRPGGRSGAALRLRRGDKRSRRPARRRSSNCWRGFAPPGASESSASLTAGTSAPGQRRERTSKRWKASPI